MTEAFGLDDLLVACGVLFACICAGYMFLEIGSWFNRKDRNNGNGKQS